MIKKWKIAGTALLAAGLTTACGSNAEEGTTNDEPQELVISTFGLSEDIMEEDIFAPFEEEYNVDIIIETGTGSERYTKLKNNPNSTVDIIDLAQSNSAEGFEEGLFEEIDAAKVPNMEYLIDAAAELSENGSGPSFTVNSIGIIYNEEAAGMKIEEWSDLWDPSLAGSISIPDIATTFGPAMLYVASDYKNVAIEEDEGAAGFEGLAELSPNIVKTYSKASDLANMFQSGEIVAAVVGDFGVPTIQEANPDIQYVVPESGTFANFNTININANSDNKELAYEFINWRISQELQEVTAVSLNEAPTNENVVLSEEDALNKTYGEIAERARPVDPDFVNAHLADWVDEWNRTLNQ